MTFDDGDPVEDAVMALTATRVEDGSTVGPVRFGALDQPGRYVAEVDYERFGTWVVAITVESPGEGAVEFSDEVLPTAGTATDSAERTIDTETLAVLFRFDSSDWTNLVVRIAHSAAGAIWVGLIGLALVATWVAKDDPRTRALALLERWFPTGATLSLLLLLASGLHSATWGTPIRAPGVFDLGTLLDVPFGGQYVAALAAMAAAWVVMVAITIRMRRALRASSIDLAGARGAAFAGVGVSAFLVVDIAVLLYLHNISHLSLTIPT